MIVCICNNVSDKEILAIKEIEDCQTIEDVQGHIPICDNCTCCSEAIDDLLYRPLPSPVYYALYKSKVGGKYDEGE